MQINHVNSFTPQSALTLGSDKTTPVNEQRDRIAAQQEQKKAQQEGKQSNQNNRLDIDAQAIALVEQNQQIQAEQKPNQQAGKNYFQAEYDQPNQQNQTAVTTYQSVGNIAQRDSIQQAFGVDLYA